MKKVILYGAGKRGKGTYDFLKTNGYKDIVCGFCDKNAKEIKEIDNKKVYLPDEVDWSDKLCCITMEDESIKKVIREKLGIEKCIDFSELADIFHVDRVEFNRNYCAFYHNTYMDQYYKDAENEMDVFWNHESEFYKMFTQLDQTNIIELACGHGRHVECYYDTAKMITLVDILQKNIDYCKERFHAKKKIKYYKNSGYDLKELKSDSYTALFCYDAMVHFELIDIYSYLQDIYRVLAVGGRALLHHSNYHADYRANFQSSPHGRSFMSKECFAYMAYRAGFCVLNQKLSWGGWIVLPC